MAQTQTQVRFVSGISSATQTDRALDEVLDQITASPLADCDLVVFFATPEHADNFETIRDRIAQQLSPRHILGGTAEGVIGIQKELQQSAGLVVLAGALPNVGLHPFKYEDMDWPAILNDANALSQTVNPGDQSLKGMMLFADPFSTPMVKLLPAMNDAFAGVPIIGGMASGAREPGKNRLLIDDEILDKGAIGLAMHGNIDISCTVSQGCRPVGQTYIITAAKRHLVRELGGKSVIDIVKQTIADLDEESRQIAKSKGVFFGRVIDEYKERFGRGDFLVRNIVGYDEEAGYLAVNDTQIRVGQTVQFHIHDANTAIEDLRMLLQTQQLAGKANGALLFSCNGRGKRLFTEPNQDASLVHESLGDVPLAGIFAAGEIGPINGVNYMHGHTVGLMVFRSLPPANDE